MISAGKMPSHAFGPKKGGAGDSFLLQKGHLGCEAESKQGQTQQQTRTKEVGTQEDNCNAYYISHAS
jgi:hypothetical protein